jgi:hypothetical protein
MREDSAILVENEASHAEEKVGECTTQRLLRDVSHDARSDDNPDDGDERENADNRPRHRRLSTIPYHASESTPGERHREPCPTTLHIIAYLV